MPDQQKLTFEEARQLAKNIQMGLYIVAAQKLGISYEMLIPGLLVEFSKGSKRWRIHKSLTPVNNSVAMTIASYKNTCNQFLAKNGLPVPRQAPIYKVEDIYDFIKGENIKDFVIKPQRGVGGAGVSILPSGKEAIQKAYEIAYQKCLSSTKPKVLAEEFVAGENYRLLVIGDQLAAAAHRIAAFVTGDGKSTIQSIVKSKNKIREAAGQPSILVDEETNKILADQNLVLSSIPPKGNNIRLRFNANLCTGGSTRECLSEVHPKYAEVAVKAVQVTGLKVAGLDIITPDITDPNVKFAINEINHDPGLRIHYMPDEGKVSDVAVPIMQYILDNI